MLTPWTRSRALSAALERRSTLPAGPRRGQRSRSLSDAGRALFAVSRTKKASSNDADRLRKYLARFELRFEHLVA